MIKKTLGIVLSILGLAGVAAYSVPSIKEAIPYLSQIQDLQLVVVSVAVLLVGLFITIRGGGRSSGKQTHEVPIYHGKHVVGYRRH